MQYYYLLSFLPFILNCSASMVDYAENPDIPNDFVIKYQLEDCPLNSGLYKNYPAKTKNDNNIIYNYYKAHLDLKLVSHRYVMVELYNKLPFPHNTIQIIFDKIGHSVGSIFNRFFPFFNQTKEHTKNLYQLQKETILFCNEPFNCNDYFSLQEFNTLNENEPRPFEPLESSCMLESSCILHSFEMKTVFDRGFKGTQWPLSLVIKHNQSPAFTKQLQSLEYYILISLKRAGLIPYKLSDERWKPKTFALSNLEPSIHSPESDTVIDNNKYPYFIAYFPTNIDENFLYSCNDSEYRVVCSVDPSETKPSTLYVYDAKKSTCSFFGKEELAIIETITFPSDAVQKYYYVNGFLFVELLSFKTEETNGNKCIYWGNNHRVKIYDLKSRTVVCTIQLTKPEFLHGKHCQYPSQSLQYHLTHVDKSYVYLGNAKQSERFRVQYDLRPCTELNQLHTVQSEESQQLTQIKSNNPSWKNFFTINTTFKKAVVLGALFAFLSISLYAIIQKSSWRGNFT